MTHLGSHDTQFSVEAEPNLAVMRDGTVVLYGSEDMEEPDMDGNSYPPEGVHVFRASPTDWTKLKQLPGLCQHGTWQRLNILLVTIEAQELLAVSCPRCGVIRLLNLETGESNLAFYDPRYELDYMCHGEEGQIFLSCDNKESKVVLLLDCSTTDFSVIRSIPKKLIALESYIPRHRLLLTTDDHKVEAFSSENGKTEWKLELEDSIFFWVTNLPHHDALLISSLDDNQVIVVNASDGVLRQTLELPEDVGCVQDTQVHGDQLIVLYSSSPDEEEVLKVGFFSLQ